MNTTVNLLNMVYKTSTHIHVEQILLKKICSISIKKKTERKPA